MSSQSTMLYVYASDLMLKKADRVTGTNSAFARQMLHVRRCTYNDQNTLAETLCFRYLLFNFDLFSRRWSGQCVNASYESVPSSCMEDKMLGKDQTLHLLDEMH